MREDTIKKPALALHLLGAPQITWRGEAIKLARRQARAMLFYLANSKHPVSRDNLLYLFWPDEPEGKARRNLTRLLSYLRNELPYADVLLANRESLRLNPKRLWVDVERFSRYCSEEAKYEQAVSLYRGPFLMGFSLSGCPEFDFWLTEEQGRYERLYLKTLAELVRVKRGQNEYAAAIQYGQQYLAVDALAEEIHRDLIRLYGAQGNQTAALKQYETCVEVLERELGVSPLPETRAAQESALQGARVATRPPAPKSAWRVLPSLHIPLAGREADWEALNAAYRQLHTGGVILISGEAGIGKTRLMQEFAMRENRTVLTGSNHPSTQSLPYHPLVQALRQAAPHPELWTGIAPIWLGELTQLLPELRDQFPDLPQPLAVEPGQAQARLFEALIQVCLGLAARTARLLLCLDDLQWVDEATKGWLSMAATRLANSHVCILGTYRQEEREAVREMQRAFRREGLLAEVALQGLSPQAIDKILEQILSNRLLRAQLAARLYQTTGGNAFFVLEMVRTLLESGQLDAPPEDLPLPKTVEQTIHTRLARLNPLARQILDAAAVLSPDLETALVRRTAGRTDLEAADGLDELVRRHLLQEGSSGLAFRHDLLRTTVYQRLTPWRQQVLHRRAGDALGEVYARSPESVTIQMAQHYDAAGAYEQSVRCYRLAASAARRLHAHEEAIAYLERAIEIAQEEPAEGIFLPHLYDSLADSLTITAQFAAAERAYRTALARVSKDELLWVAELQRKLADSVQPQQRESEAEAIYRAALTRLDRLSPISATRDGQSVRLNILLGLLDTLYFQLRPEAMAELKVQTQALLDEVGTAKQQSNFHSRLNQMAFLQNQYRVPLENLARGQTALAHAQETDDVGLIARQQFHLGFQFLWYGDFVAAEDLLGQSLAMAQEVGDLWLQNQCLAYVTVLYRFQGDKEQLAAYLPQLDEISHQVGHSRYIGVGQANTAWLHYREGEWRQAKWQAEAAVASWAETGYPLQWLAFWLVLAVARQQKRLPDAVAAARAMLDSKQQRQPDEAVNMLDKIIAAWEANDEAVVQTYLGLAVDLAAQYNYI